MSYLEDDSIQLKKGSVDQTGAIRYGKQANVPGNYVVDLQRDLNALGFPSGTIDGDFGNRTEIALRDFQTSAAQNQRFLGMEIILVAPSFLGAVNGECDKPTRDEIILWKSQGWRRPLISPPPWIAPEPPLMEKNIPFAPVTEIALYWPIRTTHQNGREVAYIGQSGNTHGRPGRKFLASRESDGRPRYHVGVDLWADEGDYVIACEDGTIVNHYYFYNNVHALIVQCDSNNVINYGEVKADSWKNFGLDIKSKIKAGQPIALVGKMKTDSMCHFETYISGTTKNHKWFMDEKPPSSLYNPTQYLIHLAKNGK